MSIRTDLLIYRVKDKGLEVFLLDQSSDQNTTMPSATSAMHQRITTENGHISLDPFIDASGQTRQAIAIEADWHDIPSLRQLMLVDYEVAKQKAKSRIKSILPELPTIDFEKGTYVVIKDAFKQVLPEQYAFLKELKEIVREKNQTRYI
jgi:hypothetical protein